MTEDLREIMAALVLRWVQRQREGVFSFARAHELAEPVPIPPELLSTITKHEPYRTQALADAGLWLAMVKPFGLGLEVRVDARPTVRAEPPWQQVVTPLPFRTTVADRMDPWSQQVSETPDEWDRVAYEDGEWKVVAIWSDARRQEHAKQVGQLRALSLRTPHP